MSEALTVKTWFSLLIMSVWICAILNQTGASARLIGGDLPKQGNVMNTAAVELTTENFNSTLWASPSTWAIVEFYAHWCPACQMFSSHYSQVGGLPQLTI
jgi:thiol oxidase